MIYISSFIEKCSPYISCDILEDSWKILPIFILEFFKFRLLYYSCLNCPYFCFWTKFGNRCYLNFWNYLLPLSQGSTIILFIGIKVVFNNIRGDEEFIFQKAIVQISINGFWYFFIRLGPWGRLFWYAALLVLIFTIFLLLWLLLLCLNCVTGFSVIVDFE